MEIKRIGGFAVPQPAMRDGGDLLGFDPCRRPAGNPGHPAIFYERELRALIDDAAIIGRKLVGLRAVDYNLSDGQLAGDRFTARFKIDGAGKAF